MRVLSTGRITGGITGDGSDQKSGIRPVIEISNCTITRETNSPVWKFAE